MQLRLPHTLLLASLVFAAGALPVESTVTNLELTPANFKHTVAKGVWFVEHFSPYCGHCRRFAPTWNQLVDANQKAADPGIHLAQVNCAVHGDLCKENGIDGYPQMNLYKDGVFQDTYKQARDPELLVSYLSQHAEPTSPSSVAADPVATATETPLHDLSFQTQARDENSAKVINPYGTVQSLDDNDFFSAVSEGHLFVKFFAPWCGHCKKLAPAWKQLAKHMQHKLNIAEVNCEDHRALCLSQDVTGYPMLYYYPGSADGKTEYTGGRKFNQLKAFTERLAGPPVQELAFGDLQARVALEPSVYLLLHTASNTQALKQVTEASSVLLGTPAIYSSSDDAFFKHFSISSDAGAVLLALKDHDSNIPAAVYELTSSHLEPTSLQSWMLTNRLPTAMELDAESFQNVMNAPHKPLVVLTAASNEDIGATSESVQQLARRWRDTKSSVNVVFTWMDADKWTKWLKSMYGIKPSALPSVVIVKHGELLYYDNDQYGEKLKLSASSLFPSIEAAAKGTLPFKHSENVLERTARYLDHKVVAAGKYIKTHPMRSALFALSGLGMLFLILRRILADDSSDHHHRQRLTNSRKGRLD